MPPCYFRGWCREGVGITTQLFCGCFATRRCHECAGIADPRANASVLPLGLAPPGPWNYDHSVVPRGRSREGVGITCLRPCVSSTMPRPPSYCPGWCREGVGIMTQLFCGCFPRASVPRWSSYYRPVGSCASMPTPVLSCCVRGWWCEGVGITTSWLPHGFVAASPRPPRTDALVLPFVGGVAGALVFGAALSRVCSSMAPRAGRVTNQRLSPTPPSTNVHNIRSCQVWALAVRILSGILCEMFLVLVVRFSFGLGAATIFCNNNRFHLSAGPSTNSRTPSRLSLWTSDLFNVQSIQPIHIFCLRSFVVSARALTRRNTVLHAIVG